MQASLIETMMTPLRTEQVDPKAIGLSFVIYFALFACAALLV